MNGFNEDKINRSCDYQTSDKLKISADWQLYVALIFSCFILGWAFFFSLLFSLSSIFLCLSGSSISLILSLISRFFFSLSSAAFSAFTAWMDFQWFSATLLL